MDGWQMHWAGQWILDPEGEQSFWTPLPESISTNEEYSHHRRVLEDRLLKFCPQG